MPTMVHPHRASPRTRVRSRAPAHDRLGLLTYTGGLLVFWLLWAAVSISTDHWYWWPLVPLVAWSVTFAPLLAVRRRD